MMRTLAITALVTILIVCLSQQSEATVTCYVSSGGSTATGCNFCSKQELWGAGSKISEAKYCLPSCVESSVGVGGILKSGTAIYCCTTELCNASTKITTSVYSTLALSVLAALWLFIHKMN